MYTEWIMFKYFSPSPLLPLKLSFFGLDTFSPSFTHQDSKVWKLFHDHIIWDIIGTGLLAHHLYELWSDPSTWWRWSPNKDSHLWWNCVGSSSPNSIPSWHWSKPTTNLIQALPLQTSIPLPPISLYSSEHWRLLHLLHHTVCIFPRSKCPPSPPRYVSPKHQPHSHMRPNRRRRRLSRLVAPPCQQGARPVSKALNLTLPPNKSCQTF